MSTLLYSAFVCAITAALCAELAAKRKKAWRYLECLVLYGANAVIMAVILEKDLFDGLRMLCLAVFVLGPIFLGFCAYFARQDHKRLSVCLILLAIVDVAVAIDAFFIEPHWLEIKHYTLTSRKITSPVLIGVLSDFQTDSIGDFERLALESLMAPKPDLILLPGDYLQMPDGPQKQVEENKFREVFRMTRVNAPFGVYAVRGNCEWNDNWVDLFRGLPVKVFPKTESVNVSKDVRLTGLSFEDSFDPGHVEKAVSNFHIVFGHGPNFALGHHAADLLVAGHTHGGQFQIPFLGPLITLSQVSRTQGGGGFFKLDNGGMLLLTKGLGMERMNAPRLRFMCRPEIVFLQLKPEP